MNIIKPSIVTAAFHLCLIHSLSGGPGFNEPADTTLRIASYNVMQDRIHEGKSREKSWARVVNAVKADVWVLQEMFYGDGAPTSQGDEFIQTMRGITGQNDWNYTWDGKGRYLMTRYPIRWNKELHHRVHATWMALPSSVSARDLVVINVHLRSRFEQQVQAAESFIKEVRAGENRDGIPKDVSIVICGDFNQTITQNAYRTFVGGLGFDDVKPTHNGTTDEMKTIGSVDFSDGKYRKIGNKRIDFFLLDSAVLKVGDSHVFNTLIMNQSDLAKFGLKRGDSAIEPEKRHDFANGSIACDHFMIVTDLGDGKR